jgi:hypothetical protein
VGFEVEKVAVGTVFIRVPGFPLPILIPQNASYSSIIVGWYSRANSGRRTRSTQSYPTARKYKKLKIIVTYLRAERPDNPGLIHLSDRSFFLRSIQKDSVSHLSCAFGTGDSLALE